MATLLKFTRHQAPARELPAGHRATLLHFPCSVPAQSAPPVPKPSNVETVKPQPRKRGASSKEDQRRGMYAKINIALAELYERAKTDPNFSGFCEDVYRYRLRDQYGTESAKSLALSELEEVVRWLASLGWKARRGRNRRHAPETLFGDKPPLNRQAQMEKIEAMLAEKGRAEGTDVPWGYAVSILKKKSKGTVKSFKDAEPEHLDMVIAALYRDAKRKGRRTR